MTWLQSLLLGIVQGITEFLPISSSAHLVIVPYWLGWNLPEKETFIFDVLVQAATLIAVIAYFWKDLLAILSAFILGLVRREPFKDPLARLGWVILLATLPAGVIGLLVKDLVEQAFSSPPIVGVFLLCTAGLLITAEKIGKRQGDGTHISWQDALWIGVFQALAVFPGISRSGATITGGMLRSLQRPAAARFSFLLMIPIMAAAGGTAILDLLELPNLGAILPGFIPGFLASAAVGYLSIHWLLGYLARRPLFGFAAYCALMGALTIIATLFHLR